MKTGLWRTVLDLLFPRSCAGCAAALDDSACDEGLLCVPCHESLAIHTGRLCPRCGAPLGPHAPQTPDCPLCRKDRFAFSGVVCLGVHDGELRRAALQGKSPAGGPMLAALTQLLFAQRGEVLQQFQPDLLIPVPQHWKTRLTHAHNPPEQIANELARPLRADVGHRCLKKLRETPRQAGLPATERRQNLRGAFRVEVPTAVRGARIILVDDVLTTGTTAQECSKALKTAGASQIFVAVLTRGLG